MPRRKKKQPEQLRFFRRGGKRQGSGRKPNGSRAGPSHLARPALSKRSPAHVTLRLQRGLPSLRSPRTYAVVRRAIEASRGNQSFQVVHHSVQDDHIHLICEADDADALSRGVNGLSVRIAKALNRHWGREGSVFDGRHHARALDSPAETHIALAYVLNNGRKHGHRFELDPCSSAGSFEGWRDRAVPHEVAKAAVVPRTWLLKLGWKIHGPLDPWETPGARRFPSH